MSFSEKTEWVPFGRRVFSLFLGQHTDLSLSLAAFCNSLSLHLQVLLECLHSFSLGDARELAAAGSDGRVQFPCPVCGSICSTPIDDLLLNVVAMRAKQKLGGGEGGGAAHAVPKCSTNCEDAATVHCADCGKVFCDECNSFTHRKGSRKEHARTPMAEHLAAGGQSGPAPSAEAEVVMCRRHTNQALAFFCHDEGCGIPICAMCAAMDHKLHNYVPLAEAHGTAAADLQAAAEAVVGPLSEVEAAIAAVTALLAAVDASTVATKGTLTVRFKGFQREVIARLNKLLAEVDAVGDSKKAALREQLEKLRVVQDRLENGKEVTVRFVEGGTPTELLQVHKLLTTGLAAAAAHGVAVAPLCGPNVLLTGEADLAALVAAVATICGVSGGDTNPAACTVEGVVGVEATVGKAVPFVVAAVGHDGANRTQGGDAVAVAFGDSADTVEVLAGEQ